MVFEIIQNDLETSANNYNVILIFLSTKWIEKYIIFLNVCKQVKEMLGSHALPLQIPIGNEA